MWVRYRSGRPRNRGEAVRPLFAAEGLPEGVGPFEAMSGRRGSRTAAPHDLPGCRSAPFMRSTKIARDEGKPPRRPPSVAGSRTASNGQFSLFTEGRA